MIAQSEYAARRKQLISQLGDGGVAIIPSAKEILRNGDSHFPFRQNSDFYYLTGFNEPEAILVLIAGRDQGEYILFNRERDPEMEVWVGPRAGQEGACKDFGADQSFPIKQVDEEIPKLLENAQRLFYAFGRDMSFDRKVLSWLNKVRHKVRAGVNAPDDCSNIEKILHNMRLFKSPAEIALMRKAAEISVVGHRHAMELCRPGMYEYELEAMLQAAFLSQGSRAPAYNHIVAAGRNSCILHYNDNNALIKDADLILIDSGAEYDNYASDITRTFPANGRFSPEQKAIYEVVLNASQTVINAVKPGLKWDQLQNLSEQKITEGLLELGLLSGKLDNLIEQKAFKRFYMHRVSHWLGLDVHDVGSYKVNGQWRALEPNMALTIEPGVYIPAHSEGVDERWWNIGVRIEDDIVVTSKGHDVLSSGLPKTIAEIEMIMSHHEK